MNGFLWTAVAFAIAGLLAIIASGFWGTYRTTDSNDFGEAFTKVARDISSYYILGYASTNPDSSFASTASGISRARSARIRRAKILR